MRVSQVSVSYLRLMLKLTFDYLRDYYFGGHS